jgi:hypothetical protein
MAVIWVGSVSVPLPPTNSGSASCSLLEPYLAKCFACRCFLRQSIISAPIRMKAAIAPTMIPAMRPVLDFDFLFSPSEFVPVLTATETLIFRDVELDVELPDFVVDDDSLDDVGRAIRI